MSVLSRRVLDGRASEAYKAGVEASAHNAPAASEVSTTTARQRRRPPSLTEQARRKANRAADNAYWKALKASGRWR